MSGPSERLPNPFVGPRSIQQGERLYGRNTEVEELDGRLQARRIVVLHSPSGAGKTSLVQAGLIPRLRDDAFDVWKPIRVNLDPTGLEGVPEGTNRYLLSAMLSLEQELPAERRRSPAQLAELGFRDYLDTRPRRKSRKDDPVVLLFDQFEEVLTVAPRDLAAKREFFTEVGAALRVETYWALFIIREDFLAAFAPYRDRIPTQMANTFRMDLLSLAGAKEAAEKSALAGGRAFPAVDQLIRDLSSTQVQQADGSFVTEQGIYVEPVQLQVVCRRLWEAMPEDDLSIDAEDIERYASVSESLAGYYADVVAKVAGGDAALERAVRDWVGSQLIVGGIRSQVRQEKKQSAGLDNELIGLLMGHYVVRTEQRAGANWYELSHDRMVEPIQQNNEAWERAHLQPFQIQAKLWEAGRRASKLLLSAEMLPAAREWAGANEGLLTEEEREFLQRSEELRTREADRRRQVVRIAVVGVLLGLLASTVMGVLWLRARSAQEDEKVAADAARAALDEAKQAQEKAEKSERKAKLAQGRALVASAMAGTRELVSREAHSAASILLATVGSPSEVRGWTQLAIDTLAHPMLGATLSHEAPVWHAAWSPDGSRILTTSRDNTARVWNADGSGDPIILKSHEDSVMHAAWSPDGSRILTASYDNTARVWNADGSGDPIILKGHEGYVMHAAWSPDGSRILTASWDNTARVWNADGSGDPIILKGHEGYVMHAAWSPDGSRILTASRDNTARVWNADGSGDPIILKGHEGPVGHAAWSPDGSRILTASWDDTARVWSADGSGDPIILKGHEWSVGHAAWSPDGSRILTASWDNTARVWSADGSGDPIILKGHQDEVGHAAWSPDGSRILTASDDYTARVWNADGSGDPIILKGHEGPVGHAAWSPDGSRILTASRDNTARVWNADGSGDPIILKGHEWSVGHAAWSPDGSRILTASRDATARVWNADGSGDPIILKGHQDEVVHAAWSPDGSRILTASYDNTARVWNADGSGDPIILKGHQDEVVHAAWSPDGSRILTASYDNTARVWNADGSGDPIILKGHEDFVLRSAWSPDGSRILTASRDNTARVWNADGSGDPIILKGHEGPVGHAAWSPDGSRILTASWDDTARVWNADGSGDPIILKGHEGPVGHAAWSPDGSRILTASRDNTARVWNADGSGDPIILKGHQDEVGHAAWSSDGSRILTASWDNTARVWLVDIPSLHTALRDATTNCLAPQQRQNYLAETRAEALERYQACELDHGRHRFGGDLSVRMTKLDVEAGELDRATPALNQTHGIERCYHDSLLDDQTLKGRIAIDFTTDAEAEISSASANPNQSTIDDPLLVACVVEAFTYRRFDKDKGGANQKATVTYSLSWK